MAYVVGIDTSTTATKALIIDESGLVVGTGVVEYPYETPHPLWSEQDPDLWWSGTVGAIRSALHAGGVDGRDVGAVGLSGQMHGLVLLDGRDRLLRKAILWNDQRTAAECDEIRSAVGRKRLIEITGNDALPGFTASKIVWVANHEPDVFAATRHVLLPKDYVRLRLTGVYAMDRAGGSGTQLFDLARRDWSDDLLATLGLPIEWFPTTHEGPEVTGVITDGAAEKTGLRLGTPVMAGGGDQAANAVATGVVRSGSAALSLGTSGVVFVASEQPRIEPEGRLHAFCHAAPDRWHLMGVMLSAGGSLRWYRDTLAPGVAFDELVAEAGEVAAGSDGLTFLPYLTGERTPHPDPEARAAFVGLTVRHTRAHLTRAVLEGVAYGLRDSLELVMVGGTEIAGSIRASGGGVRSHLWRQIIADVLGYPLAVIDTHEGAAYGAGMLAAVGLGWHPDVDTICDEWVDETARTDPAVDCEVYADGYHVYQQLYPALHPNR